MIHAYNNELFYFVQQKVAAMFELAVNNEQIEIDKFANIFVSSKVCHAFEIGDPVFVLGKSANELLALVLDKDPIDVEISSYGSPEYWVGWVLSLTQWYLNKPYKILLETFPASKLLLKYFPYHEMDEMRIVELYQSMLPKNSKIKQLRKQSHLSQMELSILSNVPIRTIKAYEQGTVDIAKGQAETLYSLAKVLGCTIEDLIV